eukprot:gene12145-15253_t
MWKRADRDFSKVDLDVRGASSTCQARVKKSMLVVAGSCRKYLVAVSILNDLNSSSTAFARKRNLHQLLSPPAPLGAFCEELGSVERAPEPLEIPPRHPCFPSCTIKAISMSLDKYLVPLKEIQAAQGVKRSGSQTSMINGVAGALLQRTTGQAGTKRVRKDLEPLLWRQYRQAASFDSLQGGGALDPNGAASVCNLAFHSDGLQVAFIQKHGVLSLFSFDSLQGGGMPAASFDSLQGGSALDPNGAASVCNLAFHSDGQQVAFIQKHGVLSLFSFETLRHEAGKIAANLENRNDTRYVPCRMVMMVRWSHLVSFETLRHEAEKIAANLENRNDTSSTEALEQTLTILPPQGKRITLGKRLDDLSWDPSHPHRLALVGDQAGVVTVLELANVRHS